MAARRARKLGEAQRRLEEEDTQRVIADQNKQLRQGGAGTAAKADLDTDLAHVPQVKYGETVEEQALKKEQV